MKKLSVGLVLGTLLVTGSIFITDITEQSNTGDRTNEVASDLVPRVLSSGNEVASDLVPGVLSSGNEVASDLVPGVLSSGNEVAS
ncbi:hypothetical protein, partial [Oceanobacillus kimchii]